MNRPSLLHIIERLEGFLARLPETIQRPVLQELTPLKELFLQQRAPRFVLTGSNRLPLHEVVGGLFAWAPPTASADLLMELFRWHAIELGGRGTVLFLDARGADSRSRSKIEEELKAQPADLLLHLAEDRVEQTEIDNLGSFLAENPAGHAAPKIVGIARQSTSERARRRHNGDSPAAPSTLRAQLQSALQQHPTVNARLLQVVELPAPPSESAVRQILILLARNVPNEARVEMARLAQDRAAQTEIAQMLVKSTTAICGAIGAQPIPLADLPILTTLQLLMVSGIMYISGRERSLRAATEFVTALGVNVGAGMILREGARALLKFFPGWGNVVCGAVAAAGTYAIGRASIVYFLEGLTLKDARRAYLSSRKKRSRAEARPMKQIEAAR